MAQQVKNPASIHEDAGLIPDLAQCIKDQMLPQGCGIGHRCGLDLELLWLWHGPTAAVPIRPPPWELPYAAGAAVKRERKKEKKKKKKKKHGGNGSTLNKIPKKQAQN